MSRFVILTMVRTGSYMLASALNSHEDIICFGELVKKNPLNRLDYLEFKDEYPDGDIYIQRRLEEPVGFVERVISFGEQRSKHCGFKLMIPQNPAALEHVCAKKEFKKIILTRQNLLAAYSSNLIARITGQGLALPGEQVKSSKILFDPKTFDVFLKRRKKFFGLVRKKLRNEKVCEIEYTEACSREGIERVLTFLGVEFTEACTPRTVKRNRGNIIDRFENPDDLQRYMKSIGRESWLLGG